MLYSILKVNKIISYNSDEEIKLDLDQCIRHYTFTKIYIEKIFTPPASFLTCPQNWKKFKKSENKCKENTSDTTGSNIAQQII